MTDFLKLSREAFDASSTFIEANLRPDWDYSIRAFRSEHAAGSKYLSPEYASRSRLFRPKTRTVIRKNEAAGAVALFSNMELVDMQPGNPDDLMSVASRDAMKAVLEWRLQNSIPTFEIVMGGIQDAQTQGMVCSYQYWEYQIKNGVRVKDKPCIDLRPIENIGLDGGASWLDPVGTSPYFYDIIPMPVCQVRGMMNSTDGKTGQPKWKKLDDKTIQRARPDVFNSLRKTRLGKSEDPHEAAKAGLSDFDYVWVFRWFMRDHLDDDYTYYTLGNEDLLTEAMPLEKVYHHGIRPYVMGYSVLETHKAFKPPLPVLLRPLQQELNAVGNDRLDNVKFVLHKRWLVARGRQVDVQSLVRGAPGGVTLTTDPKTDVQESNWPDVTSSAYVETDRLNADFGELAGDFSPNTRLANKGSNDTLGGNKLAAMGAGLMTDYLLRTITETWWEKVLRQFVKLEAAYEDDQKVLAICAKKAKLFPRYGISQITDQMLNDDVTLTVNMGMGGSNPDNRLQKFLMVTAAADEMVLRAPPGSNVQERLKELYSLAGYRDGSRFVSENVDPRLAKSMQMIKELTEQLKGKQLEIASGERIEQQKLISAERQTDKQLQVDYERIKGDLQIRAAELVVEQQRLELERLQAQVDLKTASDEHKTKLIELGAKIEEANLKLEGERTKLLATQEKASAEMQKASMDLQSARETAQNEEKIGKVADGVSKSMESVSKEIAQLKADVAEAKGIKQGVDALNKGLGALAQVVLTPKKKAKKMRLKKPDGKSTKGVSIVYDDGSEEELEVER
jgi:hypothetical protein